MTRNSGPVPPASVHPITDQDLTEVGLARAQHWPPRIPAAQWAAAWILTVNLPGSTAPNHGYLLRAGGQIVGAYLAIYSTRVINGRNERFCNLYDWFTAPEYRFHSLRMIRAFTDQEDVTFTDLTPIDIVQKLNLRLGFSYLDTAAAAIPNVPWLGSTPARVSNDPAVIASALTGRIRTYFEDHSECYRAQHLVLTRGDQTCYVVWQRHRVKRLPLFASILYISNPAMFRNSFGSFARHMLVHHGMIATIVEDRVAGGRIRPSLRMPRSRQRMFRSATVGPEDVDYLYSEMTFPP